MQLVGRKIVHYQLGLITATVDYLVSDVQFPVLSVSKLMTLGFDVCLSSAGSTLSRDGHSYPLHRVGQLIFLIPDGRTLRAPPGLVVAPIAVPPPQSRQAA